MIRIILFELTAVVAAASLAWSLKLPEEDTVVHGSIKIEVVEPRNNAPPPGGSIDVGDLADEYTHPSGCSDKPALAEVQTVEPCLPDEQVSVL